MGFRAREVAALYALAMRDDPGLVEAPTEAIVRAAEVDGNVGEAYLVGKRTEDR